MDIPFPRRILVVRRDNIGDLVCTTPALAALREAFPKAYLAALVNSYNGPVLANQSILDAVYVYTKLKHRSGGQSVPASILDRIRLIRRLRSQRFDLALLAGSEFDAHGLNFVRLLGIPRVMGFAPRNGATPRSLNSPVAPIAGDRLHEVEIVFRLLAPLGIQTQPRALVLQPEAAALNSARVRLAPVQRSEVEPPRTRLVAVHISARKASQRWPAARFVELMQRLEAEHGCRVALFWSPGDEENPLHPGDDRKAAAIVAACGDLRLLPFPTRTLPELIAGLACCDQVICSDGGAMHLAAALGKPIISFFGNSDARRWHPWGVPYELLQKPSLDVADITVDEAVKAYEKLCARLLE